MLSVSLMDSAHTLYTNTHPHTQTQTFTLIIHCSFSQEGRICCQHIFLLPLLFFICVMPLKMRNCYFSMCPLQYFYLTAFSGLVRRSHHIHACRAVRPVPSQGSGFWLSNLWLGCQPWPWQSPSHAIFTSSEKQSRVVDVIDPDISHALVSCGIIYSRMWLNLVILHLNLSPATLQLNQM